MLTKYIAAAMRAAQYEQEEGRWYCHVPGLQGLWADGDTVELCREELRSALEDWIVFGLVNDYPVPPIDGIDLTSAKVA